MASVFPSGRTGVAHPLVHLLAAYPVAGFTGALAADIAYVRTTQIMWADFAIWLITGGLLLGGLGAVLALITGWRRGVTLFGVGLALTLALGLLNAFVHSRDAWTSVVPGGITLSAITSVLAVATAWAGLTRGAR
jgi:uncharacterized membrane protein